MKRFKKITIIILIFVFSIIFCGCGEQNISDEYSLIRIHIRANSNSDSDQAVKLEVRDAITAFLEKELDGVTDFDSAYTKIEKRLDKIVALAKKTLKDNDYNYGAKARLNNEFFPVRSYEGVVVESGYYDALIIELGEGDGDNWWCVIYPPLCYLEGKGMGKVEYKSYIAELFKKFFN